MSETAAVYAIALMLFTGPNPAVWNETQTTVKITRPIYADSFTCQRQAMTFNKIRGRTFKGDRGTAYQGIEGPIVGAWCVVPIKVPPAKVTK